MDFWHGRNVLVTGGNGFLGAWLVGALVALRSRVIVLVRDLRPGVGLSLFNVANRVVVARGDLGDLLLLQRLLAEYEIEVVFHLAAQAVVQAAKASPLSNFESNIRGAWHVLEACRQSSGLQAVIVASSDKAYGEHCGVPYQEDFALLPAHPYDVSKACADMLARAYARTYGLPVAVTRCANLYGGGDLHFSRIVPGTIRSLLLGEVPVIRGDGRAEREYLYIEDAVEGYLSLGEQVGAGNGIGEAFNFGTGCSISVLRLVNTLISLSGQSHLAPQVLGHRNQGELERQSMDSTKARDRLGWRPLHSAEEGLLKTIEWYTDYFEQSKVLPTSVPSDRR